MSAALDNATPGPRSRPILFSSQMVRALLAGHKTQTRRTIKPQPTGEQRPLSEWSAGLAHACHDHSPDPDKLRAHSERLKGRIFPFTDTRGGLYSPSCPYGRPGDLLWCRETWAHYHTVNHVRRPHGGAFDEISDGLAAYRADGFESIDDLRTHIRLMSGCDLQAIEIRDNRWRPSIHMPRWASRLTLRIKDVRVERLQDISEADAIAEGIERIDDPRGECWKSYEVIHQGRHKGKPHPHAAAPNRSPVTSYREIWEAINGQDSWLTNSWVWVLCFERIASAKAAP